MKEKVGIITLYHKNYNFGGLLQAYALPLAIKKNFEMDAEQIDYIEVRKTGDVVGNKKRNMSIIGQLYSVIYKLGIIFFTKINQRELICRENAFEKFIEEIPHSETVYNYSSISSCSEQYGVFICGGDQIWNDYGCEENIKVYTLQFVSDKIRKISYAPSMAILETTDSFKSIMKNGMKELYAISVRERRSHTILQPLTNKTIEIVADPVLLLENKEWEKEIKVIDIKSKYIVCYLLGDSKNQRKAVNKFAKKFNLLVVTFPHIIYNAVRKCDLFFGNIHDYTSGPREFLGLIRNAELIITDSFHACVFSMIFQKPFVVFERNKIGEKGNMNSRIYDFLEEYHLENQLMTEKELIEMKKIPEIDFTYAHEHWKKRREESLEYLGNALKNN